MWYRLDRDSHISKQGWSQIFKPMKSGEVVSKVKKAFSGHHGGQRELPWGVGQTLNTKSVLRRDPPCILLSWVIWLRSHTQTNLTSRAEHIFPCQIKCFGEAVNTMLYLATFWNSKYQTFWKYTSQSQCSGGLGTRGSAQQKTLVMNLLSIWLAI